MRKKFTVGNLFGLFDLTLHLGEAPRDGALRFPSNDVRDWKLTSWWGVSSSALGFFVGLERMEPTEKEVK